MSKKNRAKARGNCRVVDRAASNLAAASRAVVFAECLEPRVLLSHTAPASIDPAVVRSILAQPVEKATSAQLAQVAQLGLVPMDWKGEKIFAEKDQWVVSIDSGRGKLNRQVKYAQRKVGSLVTLDRHLGKQNLFLATVPAGTSADSLLASLKMIPGFSYAEPNGIVGIGSTPNDPEFAKQWSLNNTGQTGGTSDADIDAPEAWNTTVGSSSVVVGVIDTGIDISHPDLAANIWTNPLEIAGDGIDNDGNGYIDDVHGWDFYNSDNDPFDDNGHGTHVAGIIAASGNNNIGITGVSQNAKLLAIKAFGADGFGLTADCVSAVNYATALKNRGENVRVINNSWGGGGYSQALHDAIAASGAANMLFVAAAGNYSTNTDTTPFYPASYDLTNIIAVGATNENDQLAVFSNYGKTSVDLAAPGTDIYSTVPGGGYDYKTGTSMAAAHVAGALALLWGYAPQTTPQVLKQAILSNVDVIPSLTNQVVSNGRLNVQKAFNGLGMIVTGSTPAAGDVISKDPIEWQVRFSSPIDPASLSGSDLMVNGKPADFAAVTGPQQASFAFFNLPMPNLGLQTISVAAGSVVSTGNALPLLAWSSTFYYDNTPLVVQSTTPANGSAVSVPFTTLRVKFSEPINFSSVSAADLVTSQGTVTGVTSIDSSTVQFNLSGVVQEGTLNLSIPAGAVKDALGNPLSQAYSGSMVLDAGANPVSLAFSPIDPAGSLVYEAKGTGTLSSSGDTDAYEITAPAGQLLTVTVEPSASGLTPSVALRDSAGTTLASASASGSGKTAFIASFVLPAAGSYRFVVASVSGSGAYTARATLNADVEREPITSADNGSMATAQNLGSSFVAPVASNVPGSPVLRAAVRGKLKSSAESDFYSINLNAGETFSAMMSASLNAGVGFSLLNSAGTVLASAALEDATGVMKTAKVTAVASGLYYVQVTTAGGSNIDYTLAIVRDAALEIEPNETRTSPGTQALEGAAAAMGSIAKQSLSNVLASDTFTSGTLDSHWTTYSSDPARGLVRIEGVSADSLGGALILSLNSTGAYVLNEATWSVDLTGAVSPLLTFAHASYNDDLHPFQTGDATGHIIGDGIMISDDGVHWHPIWTPPKVAPYIWTYVSLDLAAEASRLGLHFGPNFKIRFQQYDDEAEVADGRGFDNIRVVERKPDLDAYAYSGTAGNELDVSVSAITAGGGIDGSNLLDPTLSLYDSSGDLLAYDYEGAVGGHSAELFKVLPYTGNYTIVIGSGASPGEYLLRTAVQTGGSGPAQAPDLLDASDSGAITADNITSFNNSTSGRALQFALQGVSAGALINLYADGTLVGQATASGTDLVISTDGATALADGTHQFTYTQTPIGGVESVPSRALSVVIDTTAPGAIAAPTVLTSSDTGASQTDGVTNDNTPTLQIPTLPPGAFYQVYLNGVAEPEGLISAATYTSAQLVDGVYSFTLALADAAGNFGPVSAPLVVTIDTVAPDALPAPQLDPGSDTGQSNSDRLTKDNTPTINSNGSAFFQVLVDGTTVAAGPFTGAYTAQSLSDGTHTFAVAALDLAGNASVFSAPIAITIDTIAPGSALAGDLDPTFATTGAIIQDYSTGIEDGGAVALQSDGKILFAGDFWDANLGVEVYVSRYLPNGTLDTTFGTGGKTIFVVPGTNSDSVKSISVLSDGKILVSGDGNTNLAGGLVDPDMFVARLTSTGSLDNTFNTTGAVTLGGVNYEDLAHSMTVAPDGKIWVAGQSEYQVAFGLATADGHAAYANESVIKAYLPGVNNNPSYINSMQGFAVGPDNKMYGLGSAHFTDDVNADLFIMRFNLDGNTDFSFSQSGYVRLRTVGPNESAAGIKMLSDGRMIVGYDDGGKAGVMRLLPDGSIDSTFGVFGRTVVPADADNGSDYISSMVVEPDGKIVLAGNHQLTPLHPDFFAARLLSDGSIDGSFGSGGRRTLKIGYSDSKATGLVVLADHSLILSGDAFASAANNQASALVKLSGTSVFSIDLDAASDTGLSNSDNYTSATTLHFSVQAASPYNLYRDGVQIASYSTATTFTDGPLADGVHSYSFSLTDQAGNDSTSYILKVTVDTKPDPVAVDLVNYSDTGLSDTDNITSDNTPDFAFSNVDHYRLYRNGVEVTSGYTTGVFTAPVQPDGTWDYTAQTIDLAGNIATAVVPLSVTIDTVAPAIPAMPVLDSASDSGISSTDHITNSPTLSFLPLNADSPYVGLYQNGTLIGGPYMAANSAFVATASASNIYNFTLRAVDVAGNASPDSPTLQVVEDKGSPALSGQLAATVDQAFAGSLPKYTLGANESIITTKNVTLPDGKILIAATLWNTVAGIGQAALIRLLPGGAADPTFGVNGLAVASQTASPSTLLTDLIVLPDGQIVVAGNSGSITGNGPALMRFSDTGVFDTTFGAAGVARVPNIVRGETTDLVRQSDGKLVVVGFRYANQLTDSVMARFTPEGLLDDSFGSGGAVIQSYSDKNDQLNAVMIQPDGKIVVAGAFTSSTDSNAYVTGVMRYDENGVLDPSFGIGGQAFGAVDEIGELSDAALLPDGSIVTMGYKFADFDNRGVVLTKFDSHGLLNNSFGNAGVVFDVLPKPIQNYNPRTDVLTSLADGDLVVAGTDGVSTLLIRYNASGARDTTFANNGIMHVDDGHIRGVSVDSYGRVVATGDVSLTIVQGGYHVARYILNDIPPIDLLPSSDTGISQTDNLTNDSTPDLKVLPSDLYYRIYDGGNLISGLWETSPVFTPATPLTNGVHALTLRSVDAAGNISAVNPALNLTISIEFAPLALDPASDTGISSTDHITSDTTPTLNLPGARYKLYIDGQPATADYITGPLTLDPLADGVYALTFDAIDDAGNTVTGATAFQLTIDTTPPTAPQPLDLSTASDTGISATDDITKDNTPTFEFAPAAHVRIYRGATLVADLTDGLGTYTSDTLADGSYAFTLRLVDAAGVESDPSTPLVIHIDTVGPNVIQPVLISESTTDADGELLTNDDTPSIDLPGVYYFLNVNGIAANSGPQDGPYELSHLGDGLHHLTALTFDAAGNQTSSSELLVRIDTVAPKIISSQFLRDGGPPRMVIAFDDDVSQSLTPSDLVLHDVTSDQDLTNAAFSYDPQTNIATWTLSASQLPNGDFTATLLADGVTDLAANPVDGDGNGSAGGDLSLSFTYLHGDVNLDRMVSFADLVAVAQAYGRTVNGWTQGDLNGDGKVSFADLVQIAQNYGKKLDPLPSPAPAPLAAPLAAKPSPITKPAAATKPPFSVARIRSDSLAG